MSISTEIEFDELNIEIAPKVYLPIGQGGSANFKFDAHGGLEKIDGIFLSVDGAKKQFHLRPDHPLYKQITAALEKEWADHAWDQTGAIAISDYEEHSTFPVTSLGASL